MAKLQRTFLQGKMNKDLDERLIPNGQYRDAKNIQVSTSEGSDVGAVENMLGNILQDLRSKNPNVYWGTNFGMQQTPKCIGTVKDSQNEKIYWFLATDPDGIAPTSAIVEYDQVTDIVAPVLVDINNVLNFNELNLITGVNILGGMLFWTDDLSEPKNINIARFKAGSTNFITQTQVFSSDFVLEDVTVIVKSPNIAATVLTEPSLVGGNATGITPVTTTQINFNAGAPLFESLAVGTVVNIAALGPAITSNLLGKGLVRLTATVTNLDNSIETYEVVGPLSNIAANGLSCDITIVSISTNVPNLFLTWSMLLIEEESIFKNDFPRFSYRWQYVDGEYSTYAPFSEAAFVAGKFEYLSSDGYNQGMNNVTRRITLSGFQSPGANVKSIDILYKGVSSNNVYVVETIDLSAGALTTFVVTTELLGRVIESIQLLRPWDNVPRKAKAQEIIGNRVVYGNYLQNYTTNKSVSIAATQTNAAHTNIPYALQSIKSDRTYQIGVTFIDSFNRETPVFTNKTASSEVFISSSYKQNSFSAQLTSTAPSWATAYKYYIKEPSAEYYNIALDRVYLAEDGNIWLSFPSSEVNKIKEDSYIILKKQHNTNIPVTRDNRYKVLDVANEAPDYIKRVPEVVARVEITVAASDFVIGSNEISFMGPTAANNDSFHSLFNNNAYIQFIDANLISRLYKISSGGPLGTAIVGGQSAYSARIDQPLSSEDAWLTISPYPTPIAVLYNLKDNNLPEFQGRFFAKINNNTTFAENVTIPLAGVGPSTVVIDKILTPLAIANTGYSNSDTSVGAGWTDPNSTTYLATPSLLKEPVLNDPNFILGFVTLTTPEGAALTDSIGRLKVNQQIRFVSPTNEVGLIYTIISVTNGNYTRQLSGQSWDTNTRNITLNLPWTDAFTVSAIQIIENIQVIGNSRISSPNPAVFETEPTQQADLDIYYEASDAIEIGNAGNVDNLNWWNCYSFGQGVESDRIRDDYNAPRIGNGVRVSSTLDKPYEEERQSSSMIFSGIFNSTSGVNNTNQFLIAENITKDLNPTYGSIQKLHARDTDLIALCEDKCFRILANKDALYNADGSTNVTSSSNVLGQTVPFVGEYGISKNPESFASFGFRSYFTDKARGAVMRLSRDGLTDIGDKGMSYFFQNAFKTNVSPNIVGAYDSDIGSYNVVLGNEGLSFKERVDGWNTRMSYDPEFGISLNNEYYTFKNGSLWEHSNPVRSNFYGVQENSTVTPIFNDAPTSIKNFKTLSYEGTAGWTAAIETQKQVGTQGNPVPSDPLYVPSITGTVSTWKEREGIYFNYIMGDGTTLANFDAQDFSVQGIGNVLTHAPGSTIIFINGEINVSLQPSDVIYSNNPNNILRVIGTVLAVSHADNSIRLVGTIPGAAPVPGDFMLFAKDSQVNTSGLLGYYAEVKLINSSIFKEELFAVNSEIFISSE